MKGLFYATSMVAMAAVITSCGNGGAKKAAADSTAMAADSNVVVLFDGTSLDGWRGYNKDTVPSAWTLEDGCIKINGSGAGEAGARNGGDLMLRGREVRQLRAFVRMEGGQRQQQRRLLHDPGGTRYPVLLLGLPTTRSSTTRTTPTRSWVWTATASRRRFTI